MNARESLICDTIALAPRPPSSAPQPDPDLQTGLQYLRAGWFDRAEPLFRSALARHGERPDILHLHNFPSSRALSGILTDAPIFKTFHSYETLCENFIKSLPDGSICGHAFGDACRTYCGFPEGLRRQWMTSENRFLDSRAARVIAGHVMAVNMRPHPLPGCANVSVRLLLA